MRHCQLQHQSRYHPLGRTSMGMARVWGMLILGAIALLGACGGGGPAPTMPAKEAASPPAGNLPPSTPIPPSPPPYPPPVILTPFPIAGNPYPEPPRIEGRSVEDIVSEAEQLLANPEMDNIRAAHNLLNAAIAYDKANGREPDVRLFAARAKAYLLQQDYSSARRDIDWVLYHEPENIDALLSRAHLMHQTGSHQRGLDELNFILKRQPDHREALYLRAKTYGSANIGRALRDLNRLIELEPERSRGYALRARLYSEVGDIQKAEADYQKAIGLEPQEVDVTYEYAMLLLGLGRVDEARTQFKAVIEHGKTSRYGNTVVKAITQLQAIGEGNQPTPVP